MQVADDGAAIAIGAGRRVALNVSAGIFFWEDGVGPESPVVRDASPAGGL